GPPAGGDGPARDRRPDPGPLCGRPGPARLTGPEYDPPGNPSMFSRFFIDRPIFANVIAILTVLVGAVSLRMLPVEQYPDITPPTIRISATYPGASPDVLADTVAAPIEEQ